MNTCPWRYRSLARLSAPRRGQGAFPPRLIHRLAWRPAPPQPQSARVVNTTLRPNTVHYHSVTHRHIHQHLSSPRFPRTAAFLFALPQLPARPAGDMDPSRPTRSAQRLLRLFSMESARRQLRPFYRDVVRGVLRSEQERYQSRPAQAISLIWTLFGRQHAFRTLTRFYLGAVEKLGAHYYPALTGSNALYLAAGVVLHSKVYQRYVRQIWRSERDAVSPRYAAREQAVADELFRLPAAPQVLPVRRAAEGIADGERERRRPTRPDPLRETRLSDADLRALVRGVASSLSRQARLETLRRGGV